METTPISTQALPAGTRLEEFVIERVLGSGGFGITYLARDVRLGRQVVIKENLPVQFCFRDTHSLTVAPRHTHGEDSENFRWSLENFTREAAILASLDHPGIVRVLRSLESFGTAYFVMPFVEGITLGELLKERQDAGKAFAEEELRGLLERVLDALAHLHDRGIYHRDIKPGNILVTNGGAPVLIDFGSARQRLSERSMTVVESAGYTPFEQLQSRGNVGPWSDLYALGGTLAKAITFGTPPKANDRAFDDPWVPLAERADLCAIYSVPFLAGIDRALAVRIENRWKDAGEWLAALRGNATVAAPMPETVRSEMPPVVSTRSGSKAKALPWIVAACVIFGLGAWAMISYSNMQTAATAARVKDAEQRAVLAEQEQQRLADLGKAKEDAARQAAEKQRLAELAKAKAEAARQAAEQQRLAELTKAKEEAVRQATEQQRLAELAARGIHKKQSDLNADELVALDYYRKASDQGDVEMAWPPWIRGADLHGGLSPSVDCYTSWAWFGCRVGVVGVDGLVEIGLPLPLHAQSTGTRNSAGTPSRTTSSSLYPALRSAAVSFSRPAFTGPMVMERYAPVHQPSSGEYPFPSGSFWQTTRRSGSTCRSFSMSSFTVMMFNDVVRRTEYSRSRDCGF